MVREPLSDDALTKILETLPARPLLAGEAGLRVSLAGAQAKLPVVRVEGRTALTVPGQPSTHILKSSIASLHHSTRNEVFAMRLAAAAGLNVVPAETCRRVVRWLIVDELRTVTQHLSNLSDDTGWGGVINQQLCESLLKRRSPSVWRARRSPHPSP